jgi:hypothetical protein
MAGLLASFSDRQRILIEDDKRFYQIRLRTLTSINIMSQPLSDFARNCFILIRV